MTLSFIATMFVLGTLSAPPVLPVVIQPDKDAYVGKDHITVAILNRAKKATWVAPFIHITRGNGDGTYTPVYKLRIVSKCPPKPPRVDKCVRLKAGERIEIPAWDWNTGGYDQCPPRRPGHRAFKGVHQLILKECNGKSKGPIRQRVKLVTWE